MAHAPDDDTPNPHHTDLQITRTRVHKLADMVQTHEGAIREQGATIASISEQIRSLREAAATREGLTAAVDAVKVQIATMHTEFRLQMTGQAEKYALQFQHLLERIDSKVDPIQRGIYWIITLTLGAVVLGLLSLLFRGRPPVP